MARCSETILLLIATALVGCGSAATSDAGPEVPGPDPDAIHAWLVEREYTHWDAESRVHPGLNGTGRRVFLHDTVDPDHSPVGAAAVRELYDGAGADSAQIGWSVLIKVRDDGVDDDWFYYETFDMESADGFAVAGSDAKGCTFCHGEAPDVIQSVRPLP